LSESDLKHKSYRGFKLKRNSAHSFKIPQGDFAKTPSSSSILLLPLNNGGEGEGAEPRGGASRHVHAGAGPDSRRREGLSGGGGGGAPPSGGESGLRGREENEEHNANNGGGSPEKTKFAGAEHKFADRGRNVGQIDKSKVPG
jgi:hypothetical protein